MQFRPLSHGILVLLLLLSSPSLGQQITDMIAPEAATPSVAAKSPVRADHRMVVAANPLAAEAGLKVLRAGGTAADAIVAIQTVLGLVEPQSSGIGGGAFLVWYDAQSGTVTTFDGRETAPKGATAELFLGADSKPLKFFDAVVGGRSVGTPGVVRLLSDVHARHGKREWSSLMDPAIRLAKDGFQVSPRLAALVAADADRLGTEPTTRDYFFPAGKALATGDILRNPAYAATLEAIAKDGAEPFYEGSIGDDIVTAVNGHASNPGGLSRDDLAGYRAVERPAVCASYRGFDVCGMGPPSSGAIAVGQILRMVEPYDLAALGPDDPESWRILGDATRLAFADRERFLADSDFVSIPKGLLNADYLRTRSELIRRPTALPADAVKPGEPPWDRAELRLDGISRDVPSTTHFVVVDDAGNVASMTSSIENGFGARLMVAGFLLNNQLTDFSFLPRSEGGDAVANRVEPGKRPRSSMSPTIILKDGKPVYALGSPGGSSIIPYVARTIVALVDWKMDISQAIALPHLVNRFGTYDLEAGTSATALADDLRALGYETAEKKQNSGLHGVAISPSGIEGGADPRREGVALGD